MSPYAIPPTTCHPERSDLTHSSRASFARQVAQSKDPGTIYAQPCSVETPRLQFTRSFEGPPKFKQFLQAFRGPATSAAFHSRIELPLTGCTCPVSFASANFLLRKLLRAPVAQLDRACASGAQGRAFKSPQARHLRPRSLTGTRHSFP
jgi:hypothetical protein